MRTPVPLLAVLLLAPLPASADPPFPVDPSRTDPVTPRYRFEAGQADVYVVDETVTASAPDPSTGAPQSGVSHIAMHVTQSVQEVDSEGAGRVSVVLDDVTLSIDAGGTSVDTSAAAEAMRGMTTAFRMTTRGEASDVQVTMPPSADPALAEMMRGVGDSMRQMSVVFPAEPLAVGASWSTDVPFSLGLDTTALETETSVRYTYLGIAPHEGRDWAAIEAHIDLDMHGTVAPFAIEAEASGLGWIYFDLEAGRIAHVAMTIDMDQTMRDPQTGQEMAAELRMEMTMALQ